MLARSKSLQNHTYGNSPYSRYDEEQEETSPTIWNLSTEKFLEQKKSPKPKHHPRFLSVVQPSPLLARQHLGRRSFLSLHQKSAYLLAMALNNSKRTYERFAEPFGASTLFPDPVPAYKRPRQEVQPSLWNQILSLPQNTTQSLLYQICSANPALSSFVTSAHNARVAAEAARPPVNFDSYSRDCWYTMNKKYKRLSCGKQFEMMGDICQVLDESRDAIVDAAGAGVRWETRRNALEVLRKICKSIMLCDEPQIRHELMKDGYMLGQYTDSMQELARGMTKEERSRYKQEGLYEKLLELQTHCDPIVNEGLPALYKIFDGAEDDDEDGDEEQEDGEEEERPTSRRDADERLQAAFLRTLESHQEGEDETEEEYESEDEDEASYLEDGETTGGVSAVTALVQTDDSAAPQKLQQMDEPSNTHRTRVFSIVELS